MKSERYGILMIVVSLLVISTLVGVLHDQQRGERIAKIRVQGLRIAKLLARLPAAELTAHSDWNSPLQLLKSGQSDPDFAYAVVSDVEGRPLAAAAADGVIVPFSPLSIEPSAWFGERELMGSQQSLYREFYAPLMVEGELGAHVRVGYRAPGWLPDRQQLSFLAALALPVFLMTPLFYYAVRRETRQLHRAGEQIGQLLESDKLRQVEIKADGELGLFISRVNQALGSASSRVSQLEGDYRLADTSSKVLAYKKQRAESILDALPEGVLVLDESGVASFANEPFRLMFQVKEASLVGLAVDAWCDEASVRSFLLQYSRGSGQRASIEITSPGKSQGSLSLSAHPLLGAEGSIAAKGTLLICRDVSAEIMAREARSDFVANVAHELKNPMQIIAMHAECLQNEDGADETLRIEAANVIQDQVEHVSALVNNMLSITRIEMGSLSLTPNRTKVSDLLDSLLASHLPGAAEAGLRLSGEFPQTLATAWLDKDLLRVALNNLITNAIKYNRVGGEVVLGASESDNTLKIWVQDSGIGIASEQQDQVFDKFYRADDEQVRQRAGHGLGLSLVREIIELHGGELQLDSQPGQGSTFTITLHATAVPYRERA